MKTSQNIFIAAIISISSSVWAAPLPFGEKIEMSELSFIGTAAVAASVPAEKFKAAVQQDCHDFKNRIDKWRDQKNTASDEIYNELRSMPLAVSMLNNYEVKLNFSKKIFSEKKPTQFEAINAYQIEPEPAFTFAAQALTYEKYRQRVKDEVQMQQNSGIHEFSLVFHSRDIFCDFLSDNLKIKFKAGIEMVPSQTYKTHLQAKLQPYAEALNVVRHIKPESALRPVVFGAALYKLQHMPDSTLWVQELSQSLSLLIGPKNFQPSLQWFVLQDDNRVSVSSLELLDLGKTEVSLKAVLNENSK